MSAPLRRSVRIKPSVSTPSAAASTVANVAVLNTTVSAKHPRKRTKIHGELEVGSFSVEIPVSKLKGKPSRTAKSKAAASLHIGDYPSRVQNEWKVGAHVSAAGGVHNSILNAASIGANSFALFVKSQRKWTSPPLTTTSIEAFRARLDEFQYSPHLILPHGSYLINLGNPDEEKREKSYQCFLDDLKRCEQLGLTRYNFHQGSNVGDTTKDVSIRHVAACLNRAHRETSSVVTVIENMAGSGNVPGSKFEEIAQIIEQVIDKSRVGVCLDTPYVCRLSDFDDHVGLGYLLGMHINDSKTGLASSKDRHDNIGRGFISLPAFGYLMRDSRLRHIPLILETPTNEDSSVWAREIEVLNKLSSAPLVNDETMRMLTKTVGEAVEKSTEGKGKGERAGAIKSSKKGKRKRKRKREHSVHDDTESTKSDGQI